VSFVDPASVLKNPQICTGRRGHGVWAGVIFGTRHEAAETDYEALRPDVRKLTPPEEVRYLSGRGAADQSRQAGPVVERQK